MTLKIINCSKFEFKDRFANSKKFNIHEQQLPLYYLDLIDSKLLSHILREIKRNNFFRHRAGGFKRLKVRHFRQNLRQLLPGTFFCIFLNPR
jgi:hypothetical protein